MKSFWKKMLMMAAMGLSLSSTHAFAYPPSTQPKPFYMGVYLYDYQLERVAAEQHQDYFQFLETQLKALQAHGVNAVYWGSADRGRFAREIKLFAQYGISIIPQLDFAYYNPKWTDAQMASDAKAAADFINQYAKEPNIIAFSVREEIPQSGVNGLARYYAAILALAPEARFQLTNNNLGAATDIPAPYPAIMGAELYAFWWEFYSSYLATPGYSLDWVRQEADRYYWQSVKRDADFSLVVTQGGAMMPARANEYAGDGPMTFPVTKEEQEKARQRVREFAAQGRMGWSEFDSPSGKRYNVWRYYRLPQNAMRALAWTAVLQGAKSVFVWSASPLEKKNLETDFKKAALAEKPAGWVTWTTLTGVHAGQANPQFDEFAEAAREIHPYEDIIPRMSRTKESLVQSDQKNIFHNSFALPKLQGRVVVIYNANIGTWPGGSAATFKDSDDVRIDDDGNLVGYKPFDQPLPVHFSLKNAAANAGVYDVKTGSSLTPTDSQYTVKIAPGSGDIIFIGSQEEMHTLRQWMNQ